MDVNSVAEIKDGDGCRSLVTNTSSPDVLQKQKSTDGNVKRKRRRGKSKRKVMKPFTKIPWPDRKRNEKAKRNNRFRKIVLSKTPAPAPFNNNQFLMEIHKPEPGNDFQMGQTPSTRTRDSSFSVDSEENYFYSLPEDEEEFLTKEFSSVYEDAQCERLSNMSKNELIQEYLLLEAKYENLIKRTERSKLKQIEENKETDKVDSTDSIMTEKDNSTVSLDTSQEQSLSEYLQLCKEQEDQISELKRVNERLRLENENLHLKSQCSSSKDSESDSSSTSMSSSSSSQGDATVDTAIEEGNEVETVEHELQTVRNHNGVNGVHETIESPEVDYALLNGNNPSDNIDFDEP